MLLRDVEVDGRRVDVRVAGGTITELERGLAAAPAERVVDADGAALIPGLHDHHAHLLASAAAERSVDLSTAAVRDAEGFAAALWDADRALSPGRWLRAVAYHESLAGDLDRGSIDAVVPDRPARIQHRSGARWTLNSAGVRALGLETVDRQGIERDASGEPTGRLHRADSWLRDLLPDLGAPDLAGLGRRLASRGVTGVTDATPYDGLADLDAIARARAGGHLAQRVVVMGGPALTAAEFPRGLERGPVKLVIDDAEYPGLDELEARIRDAHAHGRNVAVHCVTRAALALAVAAWSGVGTRPGDRVEHASVAPPDLRAALAALGLTVVTQPMFVAERGDEYLADVDPDDVGYLYPLRSLLDAGVRVAGSSDAPYGDADPWKAMVAATTRTTARGAVVGPEERISPARALRLFLPDLCTPGGPPRAVATGHRADLCLLDCPLDTALASCDSGHVRMTVCDGAIAFER